MALSAADLQRRHHLEGAPDPFPSLHEPSAPKARQQRTEELDTDSQTAFPSLAPSTAPVSAPAKSAWAARPKPVIKQVPIFADSFTIGSMDLSNSGKDGKSASLGEVLKQIMGKYNKVRVEASTNQKTRQTTFHMKADSQKELDKAKRSLLALLSPVVTLTLNAPASTIATIIGPKGATLKQIRDQTGVQVDIPPRNTATINGNGHINEDEDEEPTVPITLTGPQPLAEEAQALINQVISTKTSKTTQRVRDIPAHILPFVTSRRAEFEAFAGPGQELKFTLAGRDLTISGDREPVVRVVEAIKGAIVEYGSSLTSLKIQLPKRQHRLLIGKTVGEIVKETRCVVSVAKPEEQSDEVTVWGASADLAAGLGAVMSKANSQYIHEFPLPGPTALSKQLLTYMIRINYPKTLSAAHPGVTVYTPEPSVVDKASILNIDLIGNKADVDEAVRQVSGLIGKLIGATREVQLDWLLHRVITGKNAKKLKQFHDVQNVQVFFPPETAEQSSVLLVYDPLSAKASPLPDDKNKSLEEVAKEILKFAKDAADVKSETIPVEKRWHEAVVGRGGTTLNAIIGEDKALSIKVGADAQDPSGEDVIVLRGAAGDVERAIKEITAIVESAKNDEIVSSFSTDFDIEREYVGRIVGAQGAGVNKLRDVLGVKVDLSDEADEKEKDVAGKKKKAAHSKFTKVKITGRKENVEEAKKRILAQVDRLADETSEVLKIPSQFHSSLIGSSGKYAIRLEEKYNVKITFPRQADNAEGKTRESLKSDEVLVKGGKKGVAQAKAELMEAYEFEKESNQTSSFTVPNRAVARILGRGGASINEIKDSTGAQIDVDKASEESAVTTISLRGTKKAVAEAKAAILAISETVTEETTVVLTIESKFHRTLIGAGGQGLKELVLRSGGPSDPKVQAGLIRFPRPTDAASDEVRLRGEPKLVAKLKAELEAEVAKLRDRVVLAVEIPASQHRALIGRGGQHLNELQDKTGTQVQFPGSRSYAQAGEPANAADLKDVDAANIVKVSGSRAACEKAIEQLKASVKPTVADGPSTTVVVPLKFVPVISQQGQFLRNLRSSTQVQVEQSVLPKKAVSQPKPAGNGTARIDEAEADSAAAQWDVSANYQDAEAGDSVWTLRAKDQAGLDRAEKQVKEAIASAERMSHVGLLTLPDRSAFPRIVGSKGANVLRLRNETGADITVSRENNTIVILGGEKEIVAAKDAILRMTTSPPGRRSRGGQD
ncbi:unnamed protein product [Mycena citricolor]|uniref:K Homology domain-containing protein n=1 Tax=Mycena citricolor TaxID=2018698 RepID=A0AAD2HTX2_9AGAR|nr:unnamed protein product [Mycena citricolor]CAK5281797.1 unnamed protein product [Mycena citricolor]